MSIGPAPISNGGSRIIVTSGTIDASMPTESTHFKVAMKEPTKSSRMLASLEQSSAE